ncbi:hypothetical protein [Paenibacillus sp. N3.4]|uniref:hypothetical protein n=1 Tax=Paenibacillus sp. N3.4 TaxID=2603222 RepID=UPI0011CAE529|nr:hypothetical protein [Paenibacillus sp. N3.4]TXK85278.1 hypothetical protein FU659_04670 [Paenibacillus sp. N3.4]
MFTWVKFILTFIDFAAMILLALTLFRLKWKPYLKQVWIAALAGTLLTLFDNWPIIYICIMCILLVTVWKFSIVPAILIALSGYICSVIASTGVLIFCDMTQLIAYAGMEESPLTLNLMLLFTLLAKSGVLLVLIKRRLGFTFLTNYTTLPLSKANIGLYLFIIVVFLGIVFRQAYADNVISALMPFQMLSMATVLFLYVMLSKELGFQR